MADLTANYGWTKPVVGGDLDTWGDEINTDLDGIDSVVHGIDSTALRDGPNDGTAYARKSGAWTHLTHTDIADWTATLAPYALTTSIPTASNSNPLMDGTVAVGTGVTWARSDHVHPSDTTRLALSGGTLTGPLTLAANPAAALQPATKQYVDALPTGMGDNRIINGDMLVNQRGVTGGATANGYSLDQWGYWSNQASKGTWGQNYGSLPALAGFPYYLGFVSSSAYTPVAADQFELYHPIEADLIPDFAFGTAGAQTVTLSFWAVSSLTGTFSGSLQNYAATRSYPFSFSLPTANTWTKIAITIPGDTGGTWVMSGNGGAAYVNFDLGSGATARGTAGAWANGNLLGATGAVQVVHTNAAKFGVTGVKLEIGSVATPFNRQSLTKSFADCQRYYQVVNYMLGGFNPGAGAMWGPLPYATSMRAAPTITFSNLIYSNASGLTVGNPTITGAWLTATISGGGNATATYTANLNAEL